MNMRLTVTPLCVQSTDLVYYPNVGKALALAFAHLQAKHGQLHVSELNRAIPYSLRVATLLFSKIVDGNRHLEIDCEKNRSLGQIVCMIVDKAADL